MSRLAASGGHHRATAGGGPRNDRAGGMKAEATRGRHFATDAELRTVLRDYIRYYNAALAYRSPIDFERCAVQSGT